MKVEELPIGVPRIQTARRAPRAEDAAMGTFGNGASPSESETVGTPGTGMEGAQWIERSRMRRERSGLKSRTESSETDSERSSEGDNLTLRSIEPKPVNERVTNVKATARRHDSRTSAYRGVSLLRQTGKFHAQINVQRKQLHLGFFFSEEEAARAYDRAAIFKASVEGGAICTNMDINDYKDEIPMLQSLTQRELLELLHKMKVKSNEASAPNSPRRAPKPRAKSLQRECRTSHSEQSETEHVTIRVDAAEPPSSPRFDALSTAVGFVEHSRELSVGKIAASVQILNNTCPTVVDMHVSKRRRTRIWPRQAPAAA